MSNKIYGTLLAAIMAVAAMPSMAQDYMNVYFKNGDFRKFYLRDVTEINVSKTDANGVKHGEYEYQHVITKHNKYIYSLNEVDSIAFTKIDEEHAEQNFVSSMPVVISKLSECNNIQDAENKIESVKNVEGVEEAWSDGHQLYVKIAEGEVFSFHFNHEIDIDVEASRKLANRVRALMPRMTNTISQDIKLKAVIANQHHKDEHSQNTVIDGKILETAFSACGIEAKYVESPTIDFFYQNCQYPNNSSHLNIYDYDIIMLETHGDYSELKYLQKHWYGNTIESYHLKAHSIATSEEILKFGSESEYAEDLPNEWKKYYKALKEWRDESAYSDATDLHISIGFNHEKRNGEWYWVGHPNLTEYFFKDIAIGKFRNKNSILFNASCKSLEGEKGIPSYNFANEFFNRDLGIYLGYTETDATGFYAGLNFYFNLLSGMSVEQARESLDGWFKEETKETFEKGGIQKEPYNAKLLILPENDESVKSTFLFPTITKKSDQKLIMRQYQADGSITINGSTSFVGFYDNESGEAITKTVPTGFKYGKNKDHLIYNQESDTSTAIGEGNVLFSTTLTNLESGQTYYYCAYTFDGLYHNYGDTCSFKIEDEVPPVCPARITNVEFLGPEYHHSSERQNQMPYTVTAALDDMTDIEEWGICYYGTTIGEFPFESISNEQSKILRLNVATSNLGKTTKVKVDFDAYVVEFNDEVGVYVKKRDKATGELMTIYGEKYPFTFRYDTKPSLVYSDPTIRETKVIGTKNGHKQYQTIVDYNYSAKGTFWMEYCSYVIVGNNWNNSGSAKLYFEKDEDGQLNSTEKYWDNSKLGHSAYEVIYLRNSKKTYSNCLNFSGSNGYINNVWVSSSPAYSARQKESNSGDSEYMNYMIINTPTEDINAKQKKVINQIPYGGGCLEEIAY